MDFSQILDSKSYDQVCKYVIMQVCKYASMQVCKYAHIYKYASMQVCITLLNPLNKKNYLTKVVKEYALIQEMSWRSLNMEAFDLKMFIL